MASPRDYSRERFYRILDGVYRIHDDLYYIEDAVLRSTRAQVRLSQIATQSRLGAAISAVVAGVPILIAVTPLDWSSAPTYWIIGAGLLFVGFMVWQVKQANAAASELELAERMSEKTPLERRLDYQLETINAYAHRIRAIEEVIEGLKEDIQVSDHSEKGILDRRLTRYSEIREDCIASIERVVQSSRSMVHAGSRSEDDHKVVLDWAEPFLAADQLR